MLRFCVAGPVLGGTQEGGAQQHRRFQPDAQGVFQLIGRALVDGADARDHAGVVDQRGAGDVVGLLFVQPGVQPYRGLAGGAQVL
jgi:hypothetical protein